MVGFSVFETNKNNIEIKLRLIRQLSTLGFTIIMFVILVGANFYFKLFLNQNVTPIVIVFLFLHVGLSLALFFQYFIKSYGVSIVINFQKKEIIFSSRKLKISYEFSQIESVTKVCTKPVAENRTTWFTTDSYFHYVIKFKNSPPVIVTCLMTDKLPMITGNNYTKIRLLPFVMNE